jgi:hypothetical protein
MVNACDLRLELLAAQIIQREEIARTEVRIEFHEKQIKYETERLERLRAQLKELGLKE